MISCKREGRTKFAKNQKRKQTEQKDGEEGEGCGYNTQRGLTQKIWVHFLGLPEVSCAHLGKLLSVFVLRFSICAKGQNISFGQKPLLVWAYLFVTCAYPLHVAQLYYMRHPTILQRDLISVYVLLYNSVSNNSLKASFLLSPQY